MRKLKLLTLMTALSVSFSAWALSLNDAKEQGLVGENTSGYLGLVVQNKQAKEVVITINAKRKERYIKLAKKNGLTLAQVEKLAATKTIQKTQSGHYIETNGQWVQK